MQEVTSISIAEDTFGKLWNVKVCDYKFGGTGDWVDFETLMVAISKQRASTVEGEITPLSQIINRRNAYLQRLGDALADLNSASSYFKDDTDGGKKLSDMNTSFRVNSNTVKIINALGMSGVDGGGNLMKSEVEKGIQLIKSRIDALNNDSSSDMTRLQGLVDKRDESYDTASSIMSEISGTRSNAIRNM